MSDTADAGSFIRLYLVENGGMYAIDVSHWDEIDAAYGDWIDRRRDRVLSLVTNAGADVRVAISRVGEFTVSTPDIRARARELENAEKTEGGFAEP